MQITQNHESFSQITHRKGVDFVVGFSIGAFVICVLTLLHAITELSHDATLTSPEPAPFRKSLPQSKSYTINDTVKAEHHGKYIQTHKDEVSQANDLFDKVRVLCWIMTSPKTSRKRAQHVKQTWGKHCNKVLFYSSVPDTNLPAIPLYIQDGRQHLMAKIVGAFQHIFRHHFHDADWFLKADDDTFVIVENLRYFLLEQNTNDPIYFGRILKHGVNEFPSGGAGYVLSKAALKIFGKRKNNTCMDDGTHDDVKFGLCMKLLGVSLAEILDNHDRPTMHCLNPEVTVNGPFPNWYRQYSKHSLKDFKGAENISQYAVSFHQVTPPLMYEIDYFLFHFKRHGVRTHYGGFPRRKTEHKRILKGTSE